MILSFSGKKKTLKIWSIRTKKNYFPPAVKVSVYHSNHKLNASVNIQLISKHALQKGAKKVIFGQRNGSRVQSAKKNFCTEHAKMLDRNKC